MIANINAKETTGNYVHVHVYVNVCLMCSGEPVSACWVTKYSDCSQAPHTPYLVSIDFNTHIRNCMKATQTFVEQLPYTRTNVPMVLYSVCIVVLLVIVSDNVSIG